MKIIENLKELMKWFSQHLLRKPTTLVHIAGGVICALLIPRYPQFAITLFVAFGVFEYWQGKKEGDTGYLDFWDMLFGAFLGGVILLIVG